MNEPASRPDGIDALTDVFDAVYRGESPFGKRPPWDIGKPQPAFVALEEAGLISGAVLDPGCGTGEDALHLAGKGYAVTGLDLSPTAISIAQRKSKERGLDATFEVASALELAGYDGRFDTVIDCGLAHTFDADKLRTYAEALHRVCRPGAVVHVLAISDRGAEELQARLAEEIEQIPAKLPDNASAPRGPKHSADGLRNGFADGWTVESITDTHMHSILPSATAPLDLPAWLGRFRRT
ncbi:class I SAM-dependent methyltransferase [Streptomyces sp. A3M-1-3]|uniref:class I SAM-dependent methyltransferase n=1 Tax=Streptomyces sp. A3M-1-3 TaxID=2962044 RepID=UPI0020B6D254|nr:class I SAM-dependent methyltransferase [Streptomyces sp. A3M-1-3]MCP3820190.1 class I SAM-dependent methyltransferase [Streptomyces sp. A3M-1-3]